MLRQLIGSAADFFDCAAIGGIRKGICGVFALHSGRKPTYFFAPYRYTVEACRGCYGLYLDVLWILNFSVDLLLLIAANRLSGYPTALVRTVAAAALGGFYGCLCIIPGWTFMGRTLWRLILLGLMGCIAFGMNKNAIRRCVLFALLSMAMGGIAIGVGSGGFISLLLCAAGVCMMCVFALRGRLGNRFLPVKVRCDGRCHRFTAMIDTGNTLTDPMTGQQVMVVSSDLGRRLLGQDLIEFSDPVSAIRKIQGGRLISYSGVGVESGLLVAKRFHDVTIGKWHGGCLVAFAPQELGRGADYEALTGGIL